MKYIRSLFLLFACLAAARILDSFDVQTLIVAIAVLLPILQLQYQRTHEVVYSRTNYVLMSLLLLTLTRYELTTPRESPDFVFNTKTQTTEFSAKFIEEVKAERQDLRDSDPEKWRRELREELEKTRR